MAEYTGIRPGEWTATAAAHTGEWTNLTVGATAATTMTTFTRATTQAVQRMNEQMGETVVRYQAWNDNMRDQVWVQWMNATGTVGTTTLDHLTIWREWEQTEEERQAEGQRRADREQQLREEANRFRLQREQQLQLRREAEERAQELFTSLLSDEQRASWASRQHVTVRGSEGGLYRIEAGIGVHGNVVLTDEHGCHLSRLCFAPVMHHYREDGHREVLPNADGYVGQMMAIRHNELEVQRVANASHRRPCRRQTQHAIAA